MTLHGSALITLLELGRTALILGATTGIAGLLFRLFGMETGAQPYVVALTASVAVPYAVAALLSSQKTQLWRWRRRAIWLGGGLALINASFYVLKFGAPWALLAAVPVAVAVSLAVERLR